jgi:AcrR family transcriptional regulator
MVEVHRGRPRDERIDDVALAATVSLLAERGYESLRMKDVAERAGIGLGALYRRWSGKQDLVVAALRAGAHEDHPVDADPVEGLVAALMRVGDAVDRGLGALVAACLRDPGSEIAVVAREAKLAPMVASVGQHLRGCVGDIGDIETRSEMGPAFILWRYAVTGSTPTQSEIRDDLLPLMGIAIPVRPVPSSSGGTARRS